MKAPFERVERIAVLRANAIGDFVFTLPALDSLRAAYPDAHITLLGRDWHADLLRGRPGPVDEVFVLPAISGITVPAAEPADERAVEAALTELRGRRFDLALQIFGGGRYSNPFISALGARYTAGLQAGDAEPLDLSLPYRYFQSEVFRLLEVVAAVGAAPATIEPRLEPVPADMEAAAEVLSREGPRPGEGTAGPLVVLHQGAGDGRRRWPARDFAAVARALAARGMEVAAIGGVDEADLTKAVATQAGTGVMDLGGKLSVPALVGLLHLAALVVANDSGPLHLARAVGTDTVGIFWCGNLINAGPAGRAHHRPLLSWRLHCPVCGVDCMRGKCTHRDSFVADVSTREVLEEAISLLDA